MGRLIVDAMNVIGSRPDGWWRDRPGAARRLVRALARLAAETGDEVTAVLDGRPVPGLGGDGDGAPVRVLYAERRGPNAADERIVALVRADAAPQTLRVATSDRELARRVRALGARVEGAGTLRDRLDALPAPSSRSS